MFKKILKFLKLARNEKVHIPIESPIQELKKNKVSNILISNLFMKENQNEFKEWLYSYLSNSENITEKKYKLLFINLYFKNQYYYINSILGEEDTLISDIGKEIIESNESQFDFQSLFKKSTLQELSAYHTNGKRLDKSEVINLKNIIQEDNNNLDKLEIAKKIYNEFAEIGILSNAIISNWEIDEDWTITKFFAKMQNFKLNNADFENFQKELSKAFKENGEPNLNRSVMPAYKEINLITQLIMNEDNIDFLNVLKQFYFNNTNRPSKWYDSPKLKEKELNINLSIQQVLNKQIEYIEMQKELYSTAPHQTKKTKKMKI